MGQGGRSDPLDIVIGALKAVFFVKTFDGNSEHNEDNSFESAQGQGRKLVVHFKDGELVAGFTMGYNPSNQGILPDSRRPGQQQRQDLHRQRGGEQGRTVHRHGAGGQGGQRVVRSYCSSPRCQSVIRCR